MGKTEGRVVESGIREDEARERLRGLCEERGVNLFMIDLLGDDMIFFLKDKNIIIADVDISAEKIHKFIKSEPENLWDELRISS